MLSGLEGKQSIGLLVGGFIWLYAAFPLMSVIRRTADRLRTPGDSIVSYMFKDFVVANIKMVGQLSAITALFASLTMLLGWATDIAMIDHAIGTTAESVQWMFEVPMMAVASFTELIGIESVNEFVSQMTNDGWKLTVAPGEAQSMDGLISVLYSFATVILILVQLYVSVAVYTFMYGLASTFMNWVKSPYLPMKSM